MLSGCGTYHAYRARSFIPGHTEPDVLACLGVPDAKIPTGTPGEVVFQWNYSTSGNDFDAEAGVYSLKFGQPGLCHTVVRFRRGYALSVHYPDKDIGPTNPDTVCGRQVAECLSHIDHTDLPTDYDGAAALTGAPVTVKQGMAK